MIILEEKHLHIQDIRCGKFGDEMKHGTFQKRELFWSIEKCIINTFLDSFQDVWSVLIPCSTHICSWKSRRQLLAFYKRLLCQGLIITSGNFHCMTLIGLFKYKIRQNLSVKYKHRKARSKCKIEYINRRLSMLPTNDIDKFSSIKGSKRMNPNKFSYQVKFHRNISP